MRKYYDTTIEITLHTNKKTLEEMIRTLVGNRKLVDKVDGLGVEKRELKRAFSKKN